VIHNHPATSRPSVSTSRPRPVQTSIHGEFVAFDRYLDSLEASLSFREFSVAVDVLRLICVRREREHAQARLELVAAPAAWRARRRDTLEGDLAA
jgi:hypothetical protein